MWYIATYTNYYCSKRREQLNCAVFTANTANDINNEILGKGTTVPVPAPIPVPIGYDFNFICGFERWGILLSQATQHDVFIVCGWCYNGTTQISQLMGNGQGKEVFCCGNVKGKVLSCVKKHSMAS